MSTFLEQKGMCQEHVSHKREKNSANKGFYDAIFWALVTLQYNKN